MFFFPPGLTNEQTEKIFKVINDNRKKYEEQRRIKEEKRILKEKYENELQKCRDMLNNSPRMSFSSLIGYSHILNYYNQKMKELDNEELKL